MLLNLFNAFLINKSNLLKVLLKWNQANRVKVKPKIFYFKMLLNLH